MRPHLNKQLDVNVLTLRRLPETGLGLTDRLNTLVETLNQENTNDGQYSANCCNYISSLNVVLQTKFITCRKRNVVYVHNTSNPLSKSAMLVIHAYSLNILDKS